MTQDKIIRMAQVNELIKESARLIASTNDEGDRYLTAIDTLRNAYRLGLKDAAPVSIEAAVLAEREACAKECDEWAKIKPFSEFSHGSVAGANNCATAIRERSTNARARGDK